MHINLKDTINYLLSPTSVLPGVAPKTSEALSRIGCHKVIDLLLHFPVRLVFKKFHPNMHMVDERDEVVTEVTVLELSRNRVKRVDKIICADLSQRMQRVNLVFFQKPQPYIEKFLKIGAQIVIAGKITKDLSGQLQMTHPKIYSSISQVNPLDVIYPQTYDLSSYKIHKLYQFYFKSYWIVT